MDPNDTLDIFNEQDKNTSRQLNVISGRQYALQQRTTFKRNLKGKNLYSTFIFLLILANACGTPMLKDESTSQSGIKETREKHCSPGLLLNLDGICTELSNHILYTESQQFKIRKIDAPNRDAFEPIKFFTNYLSHKKSIDFDIEFNDNEIFFSDDRTIFRISILAPHLQREVFSVPEGYNIGDIATCRQRRVIYFYRISQYRESIRAIGQNTVGPIVEEVLYIVSVDRLVPGTLAVHKYLYFTIKHIVEEDPSDIECYHNLYDRDCFHKLNTYRSELIVNTTYDLPKHLYPKDLRCNVLAIDYEEESTVYCHDIYDPYLEIYNDAPKHNNERRLYFSKDSLEKVDNMIVHEDWVYINRGRAIWRFNKIDASNMTKFIEMSREFPRTDADLIRGMRIFGADTRHSAGSNRQ